MKALRYKIEVCEGIMDFAHGGGHAIEELYVPELKLVINSECCYVTEDLGRTDSETVKDKTEIELDEETVAKMRALCDVLILHKKLEKEVRELLA